MKKLFFILCFALPFIALAQSTYIPPKIIGGAGGSGKTIISNAQGRGIWTNVEPTFYTSDGSFTSNRTVGFNGRLLTFRGSTSGSMLTLKAVSNTDSTMLTLSRGVVGSSLIMSTVKANSGAGFGMSEDNTTYKYVSMAAYNADNSQVAEFRAWFNKTVIKQTLGEIYLETLSNTSDTTQNKPVGINNAGKLVKLNTWPTSVSSNTADVDNGTHTPAVTLGANAGAATAYGSQWLRVGNTVTVSGRINISATSCNTLTYVQISLPVASDFNQLSDCAGTINTEEVDMSGAISAHIANNTALIRIKPALCGGGFDYYYHYTYRITAN